MRTAATILTLALTLPVLAEAPVAPPAPVHDAALAAKLGADENGMRAYVLVVLKTGPTRVADGEARDAMFAGHFANMGRLAKAGKLVLAGPFTQDAGGWRGLFVFAVRDIDEAKALVATDPVISNGEMVAEYHRWYSSAAVMQVAAVHETLGPPTK
jgi:uncharacterized protein YciI